MLRRSLYVGTITLYLYFFSPFLSFSSAIAADQKPNFYNGESFLRRLNPPVKSTVVYKRKQGLEINIKI